MILTNGLFTCEIPDDDAKTRAEREKLGWRVVGEAVTGQPEEHPEAEEQEQPEAEEKPEAEAEAEAEAEEQPEAEAEAPKPKRGRKATTKTE